MSYGQNPYGQPPSPYGQNPYGQPPYGQSAQPGQPQPPFEQPGFPPNPYPQPAPGQQPAPPPPPAQHQPPQPGHQQPQPGAPQPAYGQGYAQQAYGQPPQGYGAGFGQWQQRDQQHQPTTPVPPPAPKKAGFVEFDLPVSTTEFVADLETTSNVGPVFGVAQRPAKGDPATSVLAIQEAVKAAVGMAKEAGAEAVVGLSITSTLIGDQVEVVASATAVLAESIDDTWLEANEPFGDQCQGAEFEQARRGEKMSGYDHALDDGKTVFLPVDEDMAFYPPQNPFQPTEEPLRPAHTDDAPAHQGAGEQQGSGMSAPAESLLSPVTTPAPHGDPHHRDEAPASDRRHDDQLRPPTPHDGPSSEGTSHEATQHSDSPGTHHDGQSTPHYSDELSPRNDAHHRDEQLPPRPEPNRYDEQLPPHNQPQPTQPAEAQPSSESRPQPPQPRPDWDRPQQ